MINGIGGLVLAVALVAIPDRFLALVSGVSLVFLAGTLLAVRARRAGRSVLSVRSRTLLRVR